MSTVRVLFVCAGNTCRSPMAASIAGHVAEERELDLEIASAGVDANEGDRASDHAITVVRARHGGDLSRHSARRLTSGLVQSGDAIFVMTSTQQRDVESFGGVGKTRLLDEARVVEDPLGQPLDVYERLYDQLTAAIPTALDRIAAGAAR